MYLVMTQIHSIQSNKKAQEAHLLEMRINCHRTPFALWSRLKTNNKPTPLPKQQKSRSVGQCNAESAVWVNATLKGL